MEKETCIILWVTVVCMLLVGVYTGAWGQDFDLPIPEDEADSYSTMAMLGVEGILEMQRQADQAENQRFRREEQAFRRREQARHERELFAKSHPGHILGPRGKPLTDTAVVQEELAGLPERARKNHQALLAIAEKVNQQSEPEDKAAALRTLLEWYEANRLDAGRFELYFSRPIFADPDRQALPPELQTVRDALESFHQVSQYRKQRAVNQKLWDALIASWDQGALTSELQEVREDAELERNARPLDAHQIPITLYLCEPVKQGYLDDIQHEAAEDGYAITWAACPRKDQ